MPVDPSPSPDRSRPTPDRPTRCRHLAAIALAALLAACGKKPGPPPPPGPPQVSVVEVRPQSVTLRTELPGRTTPTLVSEVRPQVGGLIKARPFREGSDVKAATCST